MFRFTIIFFPTKSNHNGPNFVELNFIKTILFINQFSVKNKCYNLQLKPL